MIHPARYASLGEILEDAFLQYPSDTAVIEVDRDRELVRLTYAAFRAEARHVAGWLAEHGVGPGARVAIVLPNQAAWLIAATAAIRLGAVLVPLDARLTAPELAALLRHARVDALVIEGHLWRRLEERPPIVIVVGEDDDPRGATPWSEVRAHPGDAPLAPRTREDVAALVYSSGTGGDPKGCLLTHGNYLAQYQALMETFAWESGGRYLSILPTNHAIDFMCGFVASFCTGQTVIHPRTLRPQTLVDTMRRYRPTQMAVVPLILTALERAIRERLDEQPPERRRVFDALRAVNVALTRTAPRHDVSRWLLKPVHDAFGGQLRMLYCGGAFLDRERARFFADLGLPVAIGYGLTEAATVLTLNDLRPFRDDTVGKPVPGVSLRIDAPDDHGVGEVLVRGPTVFAGYERDPDQTAAAFTDGWLRTGDLGWIDGAHHLHLVGRCKNLVVTAGGKNVWPEDVEAAFERAGAEELCVVAEDFVWRRTGGLGAERLLAIVRPGDVDHETLRARLAEANRRLPDFKRVAGVLWWPTAFPRTASMKVKRRDLAEAVAAGAMRDDVEGLA